MALPIKPLTQIVHRLSRFARACALLYTYSQAVLAQSQSPGIAQSTPAAGASWLLGQSQTAAAVALPVKKPARSLTLRIKVDAVNVLSDSRINASGNTSTQHINPTPEHYISIEVRCKNRLIETRTFTTYPLGSAGEFRLQLPKAAGCFSNTQTTTDLQITLQLQQPHPTQQFTLKGVIFAEHDGK